MRIFCDGPPCWHILVASNIFPNMKLETHFQISSISQSLTTDRVFFLPQMKFLNSLDTDGGMAEKDKVNCFVLVSTALLLVELSVSNSSWPLLLLHTFYFCVICLNIVLPSTYLLIKVSYV